MSRKNSLYSELHEMIDNDDYKKIDKFAAQNPEYVNYLLGEAAAKGDKKLIVIALNNGADDILYGMEEASKKGQLYIVKYLSHIASDYGIQVTPDNYREFAKNLIIYALKRDNKKLLDKIINNVKELHITKTYVDSIVDMLLNEANEELSSYESEDLTYEKKYALGLSESESSTD